MPRNVPIEIFNIARTQVDRDAVKRWLDFMEVTEFEIPPDGAVSNPALLIALAGKRCYKSFEVGLNPNITKIRENYVEYFDNILKSGHGSVLEHAVYTFAIENVSRVFTGEMNRHRAGWAISEGSMRFIRYTDIPYWLPTSISGDDALAPETAEVIANEAVGGNMDLTCGGSVELTLDVKKQLSREIFKLAFGHTEECYRVLETLWAAELHKDSQFKGKKEITSMMRRIVGMGVATGGVWSGNIRGLRHVLTMRADGPAEEEIFHVFSRIGEMIIKQEPLLFGDFTKSPEGYLVPKYRKV